MKERTAVARAILCLGAAKKGACRSSSKLPHGGLGNRQRSAEGASGIRQVRVGYMRRRSGWRTVMDRSRVQGRCEVVLERRNGIPQYAAE